VADAFLLEVLSFASLASIYGLLALGLSVQWGYGGLFNAGVAGFWAMGAFAFALLATPAEAGTGLPGHAGFALPWVIAAAGAVLAASALGVAVAWPTLGLRTDYLAIATLGLAEILRLLITHGGGVTGGVFGIANIPRPFRWTDPTSSEAGMAALAVVLLLAALVLLEYLGRSPWGRVLKAIREDEDAAEALGKDVRAYKLQAFALGAGVMGLAGVLYAGLLRTIEASTSFTPLETFLVYVMVILGGQGNHKGAVVGAVVVMGFLTVTLRMRAAFPLALQDAVPYLRFVAVGALLIALVLFRPRGLWPEERRISTKA